MTNDMGEHEKVIGQGLADAGPGGMEGHVLGEGYLSGNAWQGTDPLADELASGALTDQYKSLLAFDGQASIMKIEPVVEKQDFSYWTSAYINEGLSYPQIQRVPVSNVTIKPHQISFDFFDTTEGKVGVSNATEKHMEVEGDIYVTELIYYFWDHYNDQGSGKTGDHTTGVRAKNKNRSMVNSIMTGIKEEGKSNRDIDKALDRSNDDSQLSFTGAKDYSAAGIDYMTANFEETQTFVDFRNTFLLTFSGWVCKFTSQIFGSFYGVFTDISYNIDDGYSDAKWHFKIEEAVFTDDYTGTKDQSPQADSTEPVDVSKDGSTTDSGGAST